MTEDTTPAEDDLLLEEISKIGYFKYKKNRVRRWEKGLMERLLTATKWNKSLLARRLKIDRANLYKILRLHGLVSK